MWQPYTQYLSFSSALIFTDTFFKWERPECVSPCVQTSQFFLSNQSHYFSTIEALLLAIGGCSGPNPANHILRQSCQSDGPGLVTPSGHPVGFTKPVQGVEGSATLTLVLWSPVTDLHTGPLYTALHSLYASKDYSMKSFMFHRHLKKPCLEFLYLSWFFTF